MNKDNCLVKKMQMVLKRLRAEFCRIDDVALFPVALITKKPMFRAMRSLH